MKRIDLAGQRFGRLLVLSYSGDKKWLCRCDDGNEVLITGSSLRAGLTTSCGCARRDELMRRNKKDLPNYRHGKTGSRAYRSWNQMIQRCCNPNSQGYQRYGARGITVCRRWRLFIHFFADMGERPEGYELDREDFNGNYKPSNCRWIPRWSGERRRAGRYTSRIIVSNG